LPEFPRNPGSRLRMREKRCMSDLKRWRDQTAGRLGLDAALILTNDQIKSLALARPAAGAKIRDVIKDWQARVFGEDIRKILQRY